MREVIFRVFMSVHSVACGLSNLFPTLALGVFSEGCRRRRQVEAWQTKANLYCNDGFVQVGLRPWELLAVREHATGRGKALVIGSGGGREMAGLCELGYEVEGIDGSRDAVDFSNDYFKRFPSKANAVHSAVEEFAFDTGPYDLVFFSWYVFSYVFPKSTRRQLLQRVAASLAPEGVCIMILSPRDRDARRAAVTYSRAVSAVLRSESAVEEGDWFDSTLMVEHVYSEDELSRDAMASGLALVDWVVVDRVDAPVQVGTRPKIAVLKLAHPAEARMNGTRVSRGPELSVSFPPKSGQLELCRFDVQS